MKDNIVFHASQESEGHNAEGFLIINNIELDYVEESIARIVQKAAEDFWMLVPSEIEYFTEPDGYKSAHWEPQDNAQIAEWVS